MVKLPILRPLDTLKKLEKAGFKVTRHTGSHARLVHPDGRATTVALHNRDMPKGTLRAILRQCEMTIEEFLKI
jgi:predicted RNA binding protein YcfA (HicA-like mRNA interferase family)